MTTTTLSDIKCIWTRLQPQLDPKYGLPCARSSHGFSSTRGGDKFILYGGEHVARTPIEDEAGWVLERSSPLWQWRRMTLYENRPPSRIAHAQAVHNDKDVYVFGGRQGITMDEKPLNDLWKLDAATETWTKIQPAGGDAPDPRSFHKMVCIQDSLYVFGGCGASGRLADLHRFDIETKTWHFLGASQLIKGRGGANLLALNSLSSLAVVAGFAGEETADGHLYNLQTKQWNDGMMDLQGMRPRSVCVSGSFPSLNIALVVGGEVDPSHRGHEGAGCFANDVVVLDEATGAYVGTIASKEDWPEVRGWSDAATCGTDMFVFGGLAGDDVNPKRLDDLWQCAVSCSKTT